MSRPTRGSRRSLPVRGCHPLWPAFPDGSGYPDVTTGLVRVRSPLLAESRLMSFPPGTEMFQFPGFASPAYGFSGRYRRSGGLPHSEIHGSKPARGSPWLIAACHVLHRLSVPRHPPDALQTLDLTYIHTNAPRAGESPQGTRPPARRRIRQRCIIMTQPTVSPLLRRRPCRVILGHLFSSHVKDPIPALERISAFSLIGYHRCRVIEGHRPSLLPFLLVEADGIEPTTSCLQSTRSPN